MKDGTGDAHGVSEGRHVVRVGLTGGIASGKSTASARFAELGAAVVDHDQLAREVVARGTPGLAAVVAAFGPGVLTAAGDLDRAALGARVFADEVDRERLNGIVHPLVRRAAVEAERAAVAAARAVVVHDIPLLVETGQADRFDVLVVVSAPPGLRVRRLVDARGLDEAAARARVAAQTDEAARRAVADVVLDGSASVDHLRAQVDALWPGLLARAARRTGAEAGPPRAHDLGSRQAGEPRR